MGDRPNRCLARINTRRSLDGFVVKAEPGGLNMNTMSSWSIRDDIQAHFQNDQRRRIEILKSRYSQSQAKVRPLSVGKVATGYAQDHKRTQDLRALNIDSLRGRSQAWLNEK